MCDEGTAHPADKQMIVNSKDPQERPKVRQWLGKFDAWTSCSMQWGSGGVTECGP